MISLVSLLLEVSIEDLRRQWVDRGKMDPDQFECAVRASLEKSAFTTWLVKKIAEKKVTVGEEDIDKWNTVFKVFERYKQRFPVKDINQIQTQEDVNNFVQTAIDLKSKMDSADKATAASKDQYAEFYKGTAHLDGDTYKVYVLPKGDTSNYQVSRALGGDTHWCTASSNTRQFNWYISRDSLIIFISTTNPKKKFQLHVDSSSFMNKLDKPVGWDSRFAQEACQWVVKNGIAKDFPQKFKEHLKLQKLEQDIKTKFPREQAPKLQSFEVFKNTDYTAYYFSNISVKDYWALKEVLFGQEDFIKEFVYLLKGNVVAVVEKGEDVNSVYGIYQSPGDEWEKGYRGHVYRARSIDSVSNTRGAYETFHYLNEKYGVPIPLKLLKTYSSDLPEPDQCLVEKSLGGRPDASVYFVQDTKKAAKLISLLDISEYYATPGTYICGPSVDLLDKYTWFISVGKGRECEDREVVFYNTWESEIPSGIRESFVNYLVSKNILNKNIRVRYCSDSKLIPILLNYYAQDYKQPDFAGATNIAYVGTREELEQLGSLVSHSQDTNRAIIATIGKFEFNIVDETYGHAGELYVGKSNVSPGFLKKLGESGMKTLGALLKKYDIKSDVYDQTIERYFPNLNGADKETTDQILNALPVPRLLRSLEREMKAVNVPLYRSRNRVIRLQVSAVETTWGKVKYNFLKSTDHAKTISRYATDESPVYLYWNGDTWNCTIICKDPEGNTRGIIKKRGDGVSASWDYSHLSLDADQVLQESFFDFRSYLSNNWLFQKSR